MTNVIVDLQIESKLTKKDYPVTTLKVSDYKSVRDAVDVARCLLKRYEEANWGVVELVFDSMEDMALMPTYHRIYRVDGKEISQSEFNTYVCSGAEVLNC